MDIGIGKTGVAIAVLVAFVMCLLNLIFHPLQIEAVQYGTCLPSPDSWQIFPFWSWIINLVIIALITILLWLANKSYNFLRTTEPVVSSLFPLMAASSVWFTSGINTSVILCLVNLICLCIILGTYDSHNATQQMFIPGMLAGMGSMFQYAFLPMAAVYVIWTLYMKVFRLKEILAFFIGILCPYWIALGTGWLRFTDFHFPSLSNIFNTEPNYKEIWLLLAGVALTAGVGFILVLINSMKLYAGNSKINAMNLCISTLGAACVICMVVDYDNLPAYVITLYMTCAVQIANICALWNPRKPWLVTLLPSLCYIGIFVLSIIL